MKVLLDSNVIIAAFATRGLCCDLFELCLSEYTLITSDILLQEIAKGLKNKLKLHDSIVEHILSFLSMELEVTMALEVPHTSCRDKSDNEILGVALAGKAEAIITGDQDLLVLKKFRSIPILSPRQFWHFLQKKNT